MKSWLIALRIARREARRAKGRTALVVAMIAVPIAALSFAAATYDMYRLTPTEKVTRQMGTATAIMSWNSDNPTSDTTEPTVKPPAHPHTAESLLSHLPAGSRLSAYWESAASVRTKGGIGTLGTFGMDATDPLTNGIIRVTSGRAPRVAGEVDVSPGALHRLGSRVGGSVTVRNDGTGNPATYKIVGVVEIGGVLQDYLLFTPDQQAHQNSWLVGTPGPVTEAMSQQLGSIGIDVTSRELTLHPPPAVPTHSTATPTLAGFSYFGIGTLITGLGLLEVILLAGPAFAVGARRRQRDLALVETAGGTPSTLRRIVLADGIVGGLLAAIAGLVVGLGVAVIGRPWLEAHLVHVRFGAYRVSPVLLIAIAGLAILTGLIGALVPAVNASRQDVVAALTGRRGIAKSRVAWLVLGLAGVALGAVVAFAGAYRHMSNIVLAGLVIGELGMVLCTPKLVGLVSRIGRFLPVAPRIALRDTARRRGAAAPAISAVMAAVAGSIALTVYLGGSQARTQPYAAVLPVGSAYVQLKPGGTATVKPAAAAQQVAQIDAAVAKILPGTKTVTVTTVDNWKWTVQPVLPVAEQCPYEAEYQIGVDLPVAEQRRAARDPRCNPDAINSGGSPLSSLVTDSPDVVAAVLGLHGAALQSAVDALAQGRTLVTDARYVSAGMTSVTVSNNSAANPVPKPHQLPAVAVAGAGSTMVVLPPAALSQLGVTTGVFGVVTTPATPMTQTQRDAIMEQGDDGGVNYAYIENGPSHDNNDIALILAIAAAVIALGAAAIATGLAAVDGRGDLRTLGAVGASPRVRRVLALSQSGVIAGLGSLLGAVAGFGAGAAVLFGLNQVYAGKWPAPNPYPIAVPWLNLLISVLVVPIVAMLGAGLLTRSQLPSERRAD